MKGRETVISLNEHLNLDLDKRINLSEDLKNQEISFTGTPCIWNK